MFDQAISGTENRARRKLDELLAQRAHVSEERLSLLEEILTVATDPDVPDIEVGARLRADIGMDRLQRDHGHLALINASFTYLRDSCRT